MSRTMIMVVSYGLPPKETVEHLFFQCDFSAHCWASLGISWPASGSRLELLHAGKESWGKTMFMEIFPTAAWSIWKESNNKHFRGVELSHQSWLTRFKEDLSLLVHRFKERLEPFITSFVNSIRQLYSLLISLFYPSPKWERCSSPPTPRQYICNIFLIYVSEVLPHGLQG